MKKEKIDEALKSGLVLKKEIDKDYDTTKKARQSLTSQIHNIMFHLKTEQPQNAIEPIMSICIRANKPIPDIVGGSIHDKDFKSITYAFIAGLLGT